MGDMTKLIMEKEIFGEMLLKVCRYEFSCYVRFDEIFDRPFISFRSILKVNILRTKE